MPRVNIYIRNEDYDKWLEIKDKPEFISTAINKLDLALQKLEKRRQQTKIWNENNKERKAELTLRNIRKYRKTDEMKRKDRARGLLGVAVRRGKIVKPVICDTCGGGGRIEGHHEDYDRPLEPTWLCRKCHEIVHHPTSVV